MAPRTAPPFRADHVGSLLRPPALLRARADRAAGTISAAQLTQAEDDAIRAAVAMQEAAGLRSATDGEFRRAEWHTDFIARLGGIGYATGVDPDHQHEPPARPAPPCAARAPAAGPSPGQWPATVPPRLQPAAAGGKRDHASVPAFARLRLRSPTASFCTPTVISHQYATAPHRHGGAAVRTRG